MFYSTEVSKTVVLFATIQCMVLRKSLITFYLIYIYICTSVSMHIYIYTCTDTHIQINTYKHIHKYKSLKQKTKYSKFRIDGKRILYRSIHINNIYISLIELTQQYQFFSQLNFIAITTLNKVEVNLCILSFQGTYCI